jgi:hypothetical protein
VKALVSNSSWGRFRIITESEHRPIRNKLGVIGTGIENKFLGFNEMVKIQEVDEIKEGVEERE